MDNILANLSKEELTRLIKVFDIQIAVVIILIVFFTKTIFAKIILNIINKFRKINKKPEESGMFKPLKVMYVFMGIYLAVKILPLSAQFDRTISDILKIAITIFITKIITTVIIVKDSKIFKKAGRKSTNETVNEFICKILRVVVWLIAGYIIFLQLGIDLSALVAGLGIGTVIISLAAQDTVKSLLSGFYILSDKPFIIGDFVNIGTHSGTVIDINFRSTRIREVNNSVVSIPNSTITSDYIVNWARIKTRRFDCTLNLKMNVDPEKIKKLIKELKVVICSKEYVKNDTVYVGFNKIADYSYDIKIFLYVTETDYNKYLKCEEDLNCEFLKILEKEQIELAFPTKTVHIENNI